MLNAWLPELSWNKLVLFGRRQIRCGLHWWLQECNTLVATAVCYFEHRVIQLDLVAPNEQSGSFEAAVRVTGWHWPKKLTLLKISQVRGFSGRLTPLDLVS